MRVLAVSFMLPPMLYPQAIQIGRLLGGAGMELVTVSGRLSCGSAGPAGSEFEGSSHVRHRIELPHQAPLSGMAHRLAMRLVPLYGRSPDEFVDWSRRSAIAAADWLQQNPSAIDVVATFGEPMSDHLVGLELKRRFGLPWLAHFSDPWADNPFRRFQPIANWRNRVLEARVIREADCIVFTSIETLDMVMSKYPEAWKAKARVLPHSFKTADFAEATPVAAADDKILLRYLGNFYGHRTPFPLFEALERLVAQNPEKEQDFRVELVGSLPKWMRLHRALKRLPPGLLTLREPVSYRQSLRLMQQSDLLLVIDAPAKTSVFLPSKLVDYIGSGRPILGIVPPGASQKLIRRLGGSTADPAASMEVDVALTRALGMARDARVDHGIWGAPEVRMQFEIGQVAKTFAEMLERTRSRDAS
jgi:hypothetical protein